jgi:hypothetical protein
MEQKHARSAADAGTSPVLVRKSKRYEHAAFTYWWDITPALAASLDQWEAIEFVKKDTAERCTVPVSALEPLLVPERRTTRSSGNWGIRVLADRPGELAFEPGKDSGDWLFLPVAWLAKDED